MRSRGSPEIATVDLSAFGSQGSPHEQKSAAAALRDACTTLGCVNFTGTGLSPSRIEDAFTWAKKLFDLSHEDKMKAPHPDTAMPHRGYSGPGLEKVYSKGERDKDAAANGEGASLRQVEDFKVSAAESWNRWLTRTRRAMKLVVKTTPFSRTSGCPRPSCRATVSSPSSYTGTCTLPPCGFWTLSAWRSS